MSDVWAPVVAALGASLLTIGGTYGMERLRETRGAQSAAASRRRALYAEFILATGLMLVNGDAWRAINENTSKAGHAVSQLTKRSLAQPTMMEFLDLFQEPKARLMKAWSDAYLVFEQDEIDAVNTLVNRVLGIPWENLIADPENTIAVVADARRDFTRFARSKLGESVVRLEI